LGALGSTVTPQGATANPQIIIVGLLISALAKSLPSLPSKDGHIKLKDLKLEDVILFASAVVSAFALLLQKQNNLPSQYQFLPILCLLIGILGKTGVPMLQGKSQVEDKLAFAVAIIVIVVVLAFGGDPTFSATVGVFSSTLVKTLTSSDKGS